MHTVLETPAPSVDIAATTGGDLVVSSLIDQGVMTLFGLPGIQLDALFCALHDRKHEIRVVESRHEQGCAYMAFGCAEATGQPAAYAVVPGPGFLNSAAGLSTAYACHSSVLALVGQIDSGRIGQNNGELHELPDQSAIVAGLTRSHTLVRRPEEIPAAVSGALMRLSRPGLGPVAIELPPDVLAAPAMRRPVPEDLKTEASALDIATIDEVAALLDGARKPLMFVGRGAVHAATEIRRLAAMMELPVVAQGRGKGIMDDRDLLSLNLYGASRLWHKSDLILAVGTRMKHPLLNWKLAPHQKLILIDTEQGDFSTKKYADVIVRADAALAVGMLADRLAPRARAMSSRRIELSQVNADMHEAFEKHLGPQMNLIRALRAVLPENGLLVSEYTQIGYVANAVFPTFNPGTIITPGYQGTLGFGFATALGAKVGCPDRPVLSICGDGGFLFTATELATAVKHRIGTVTIVFNDGRFGNVRRMQENEYGGRVIATDLHNPDFVRFARSFGAAAVRVEGERELGQAVREGFERDIPTVIEVLLPALPNPWPLILPALNG